MRAIIRIKTNVEDERIDDILKKYGWLPRIKNQEVLDNRRDEILAMIHKDDLEVVNETILPYTLLDDPTKTWGIVNRPADNLITFRLKNQYPDRLKTATEKLIRDLQKVSATETGIFFEFDSKIEVLEPGGFMHALSGSVLPTNRLILAIQRRRSEWLVGIAAFITAMAFLFFTIPPFREAFFGPPPIIGWGDWTLGFLERLSTSAIVTGTVSWLTVFLYWFELRRQSVIVWEA